MHPKILVGCPTSNHKEYCLKEYVNGVKSLSYPNYDILIIDNSEEENYYKKLKEQLPTIRDKWMENARDRIVHSRNLLRKKVLEENYDYFLSLEQDVIPPKDIIERLLKHNKKIVSALYFKLGNDNKTLLPLVLLEDKDSEGKTCYRRATLIEVEQNKLLNVACPGLGCVLIHRSVLGKIEFRYDKEQKGFDDVFFCKDAENNGFKIYCDTSIKCKHLVSGMDWNKIKK
ncbi:MAG: hypothetical protein PHD81_00830 [Candidatus Nanoarchaeia archaeon]|nr:hypothetical protein [Candidatus Nanoarchaeia archaeon]MDD5587634.1 hypothetical protein [Candidatus Nanoarchaeia archaeon]